MTATVHHIRPAEPDPLAELHAERDRLGAELQRFVIVDERRNAADAKIAEVDAALGALDRTDREAVERWAESAEASPPAPRLDEGRRLLARRLDAEAERQAAEVAVKAVEAKRVALIHQLNAVGAKIMGVKVGLVVQEAKVLHAESLKLAAEMRAKLQQVMGLRAALIEMNAAAVNGGNPARREVFGEALQAVEGLPPPEVTADRATVDGFTAQWRERLR